MSEVSNEPTLPLEKPINLVVRRLEVVGSQTYYVGGPHDHFKKAVPIAASGTHALWMLTDVNGNESFMDIPHTRLVAHYRNEPEGEKDADTSIRVGE